MRDTLRDKNAPLAVALSLCLVALTVFAVGCGGGKNVPDVRDGSTSEAALDELLKAYSVNPAAADEKYKGKVLKVVAYPVRMKRIDENTVADYYPIGHMDPARAARFYFASEAEAAKLKPGPSYTITGTCEGLSGNVVVFRDCKAVENSVPVAPAVNQKDKKG